MSSILETDQEHRGLISPTGDMREISRNAAFLFFFACNPKLLAQKSVDDPTNVSPN
jgi:hypothetical protein